MPELVLVFFRSSDQMRWEPIAREDIPAWLRDETIIERMIKGEIVRNIEQENRQGMAWFAATAVDRMAENRSSILLPPRLLVPTH